MPCWRAHAELWNKCHWIMWSYILLTQKLYRLNDRAIDVALINGIFNLNPARDAIFNDLARVVRLGGTVFASELILREPLIPNVHESETDWLA